MSLKSLWVFTDFLHPKLCFCSYWLLCFLLMLICNEFEQFQVSSPYRLCCRYFNPLYMQYYTSKDICNRTDCYTKTVSWKNYTLKMNICWNVSRLFYLRFPNCLLSFPHLFMLLFLFICYGLTWSELHPLFSDFHEGIDLVILVSNSAFTVFTD